jgi:hypothetical protein
LFVDLFLEAHRRAPGQIILDPDATDHPLHGHQEGRFSMGMEPVGPGAGLGRRPQIGIEGSTPLSPGLPLIIPGLRSLLGPRSDACDAQA